jgi:hypothetical protein
LLAGKTPIVPNRKLPASSVFCFFQFQHLMANQTNHHRSLTGMSQLTRITRLMAGSEAVFAFEKIADVSEKLPFGGWPPTTTALHNLHKMHNDSSVANLLVETTYD